MICDMEATHKDRDKRLKHKGRVCQVPDFNAESNAASEGEDIAADLAVELLIEEQRISKRIGE